jgi:N-acetylglutamate synthase-like GNAT family acetyltransferase
MIQRIARNELELIRSMAYEIWPICFKEMISEQQIKYMLEWMYNVKQLEENTDKGHEFIVLKDNEEDIGFASFEIRKDKKQIRLHKLYVNPKQHHRGSGRKLLDYIYTEGRKHNLKTLDLFVNRTNPAVSFYHKIGFEIVESINLDIGNGYFMNDYRMKIKI